MIGTRTRLVAAAALLAACGSTGQGATGGGEAIGEPPAPTESVDPAGQPGPTGDVERTEDLATGPVSPDGAPHHVENRGWRRRRPVDPVDQAAADAAAPAVVAALGGLRQAGTFEPDDVAAALAAAGHDRDRIVVRPMEQSAGAVYGVRVGATACIHGDVRPERALVEVAGLHLEGCVEPPTGH